MTQSHRRKTCSNRETRDRIGIDLLWPLRPGTWDEASFYSLIEVVHDPIARPRHR